jgi:hypothetical protein
LLAARAREGGPRARVHTLRSGRVRHAGALLGGAILAGLIGGALLPAISTAVAGIAIPALGFQTLLTVGALPSLGGRGAAVRGLKLLGLHLATLTAPLAVVGVLLGLEHPLGFGVFVMAVVPPAALVPTYAEAMKLDVGSAVAFCLTSYAIALVATPAALVAAAGSSLGRGAILSVLGVGLVAPTIAGRVLHRFLMKVPTGPRQVLVAIAIFLITFSLGGDLLPALSAENVTVGGIGAIALLLVARTAGSGWIAGALSPANLGSEAALAGGFKNIALSAGASAALMGSAAALPSLLAFPVEACYFMFLAQQRPPSNSRHENASGT